MCVTLYLVLEKYLNIDNNRLEDWFTSYIELLHRFKLWSTATAIIKACKVQNVRERNEVNWNYETNHLSSLVLIHYYNRMLPQLILLVILVLS